MEVYRYIIRCPPSACSNAESNRTCLHHPTSLWASAAKGASADPETTLLVAEADIQCKQSRYIPSGVSIGSAQGA